ncbi:MAG: S41 family peptidase [Bacteroidales bacterium]|nr:S41 family peptidase [Bacteroidales bacterium]
MKKINILIFSLVALVFTSCEHAILRENEPKDPVSVFEYLWNKVDQQYVFFDIKGVNWDSVHTVYRAQVYNEMTGDSLFRVCGNMLRELKDGHTDLLSDFNIMSSDTIIYNSIAHSNINNDVVNLNYLTLDAYTTGSFRHNSIRDGKVGYIRYTSFSNDITDYDLIYLLALYDECDGLILDLRQNGGGSADNIYKLLSIFDCHKQPLYTMQTKSGPDHNDFTTAETAYAPEKGILDKPYTKPVAVLIDRGSFSATSYFAICTQAFDNIQLFGDYTGGGLGMPNGGLLPNGWMYRFSVTRSIALDGGNYENGVPPTVRVLLDPAATAQGKDNVIETAADWIQQGGLIAKK